MANQTIPNIPVLATQINDTDLFEKADGPAAGQSQRVPALLFKTYLPSYFNKVGTAYIGGDQTGNARGNGALDVQGLRLDPSQVSSGNFSACFGANNTASGNYSVSIGYSNISSSFGCVSIGDGTTSSGTYCISIGNSSTASGNYSVAIGVSAQAIGIYSSAIGKSSTASGNYSTAIGFQSKSIGDKSTSSGYYSTASGKHSTCVGYASTASGDYSSALGGSNNALGKFSTASGYFCTASADYSSAFGLSVINVTTNSIEIGQSNTDKLRISSSGVNFITSGSGGFSVNGAATFSGTFTFLTTLPSTFKTATVVNGMITQVV